MNIIDNRRAAAAWQEDVLRWLKLAEAVGYNLPTLEMTLDPGAITLDGWLSIEPIEITRRTIAGERSVPGFVLTECIELHPGSRQEPPDVDLREVPGTETSSPADIALEALTRIVRATIERAIRAEQLAADYGLAEEQQP
jgi:hypothetical protein